MKKKLFILLALSLIFGLAALVFSERKKNQSQPIISPLILKEEIFSQENKKPIWQPQEQPNSLNEDKLFLEAKSALAIDWTTDEVLFAKNAHQGLPIASLTKLMTAFVAQEIAPLKTELIVSQEATKDGEASMGLLSGEKLTLEELLYGLFLVSGNDAANVIAENLGGRKQAFVAAMNQKAKQLGLEKTIFYNPHGLDEEDQPPNQSTAYELAILTRALLDQFPQTREIVKTREITFPATKNHQEYRLKNVLGLEETYPGMVGVKPGNTFSAGYCLVGLAQNNGHEVLTVLLNSPNPKEEVRQLFNFSFSQLPLSPTPIGR